MLISVVRSQAIYKQESGVRNPLLEHEIFVLKIGDESKDAPLRPCRRQGGEEL
jgi:hypothetical protein